MADNLISIIIPTFNRGYIIDNAIQSIIEQTIANWELVIVDDASTDDTKDIVKKFADPRIIYIRNKENMGANYSRNRGAAIAKGRYLAFLDSDNVWRKDKLEKQLTVLMNSEEDVAFAFSKEEVIREKSVVVVPETDFKIKNLEKILHNQNVIDTSTVLLKREVFEKVGGFDEDMPRLQDWDIFFKIIVLYHYKAIYIPEILDCNILQPNSIGNNDYKYQVAISIFLRKYCKYLDEEEIVGHLIMLLKKAKDKKEALLFIKEFVGIKDIKLDSLCIALADQFYDYSRYYNMLCLWKRKMEKSIERTIFSPDFRQKNLVIALYGLGTWGNLVYNEARNCGIKIKYGIDIKVKEFYDVKVVAVEEIPESVELIIVSIFQEYDKICEEISKYYSGKILSIEDMIKETELENRNL
ncbi:MAG: glycosyltransferase family 2 protein [Lachnospiraceae bacterium]